MSSSRARTPLGGGKLQGILADCGSLAALDEGLEDVTAFACRVGQRAGNYAGTPMRRVPVYPADTLPESDTVI